MSLPNMPTVAALFVKTVLIQNLTMETKPTIYVLAGANGVGKTTVNAFFIPKEIALMMSVRNIEN